MELNEQEIANFNRLLEQANPEDSLGYTEVNGLLYGLNVGPLKLNIFEKVSLILLGEINLAKDSELSTHDELLELVQMLDKEISTQLLSGERILLPCALVLEDEDFQDWLSGFFEALFLNEDAWYKDNEEEIAQMLLPFYACFQELDDPELEALRKDKNLLKNLSSSIPLALQDLYLFYNS